MIAIITYCSTTLEPLSEIISKLGYQYHVYEGDSIQPDIDFNKYNAIIISGSEIKISEEQTNSLLIQFDFLKNTTSRILGIGFGHQILGIIFGSRLQTGIVREGITKVRLINRGEQLFNGIRRRLFQENHNREITLPSNFVLLAYSENCGNEAMKHTEKKIFGVQFYPELSGVAGLRVINNFLKYQ